jgi:alkanesulfonate monooxygenase SsuD/methylene tetrahydromethanopterin reductase-like flavin-dependent oxidoreductase (luciferase family)
MSNIVLRFDMRAAPFCPDKPADRYRAAVEMGVWADDQAVDVVGLSEHHNSSDGYLSSPLQLAGMIAAQTRRVTISVSALLVPLHEPLRLAEDIAVLDLVSNGRFVATAGIGYRETEYQMMASDWSRRGALLDESLSLMFKAWSGEPFEFRGTTVQLNPIPKSNPRHIITIGGNSKAAARRAARFGLMFCPAIDDPALGEAYHRACSNEGFKNGFVIYPNYPSTSLLAEDPDKAWAEWGEYLLFDATAYGTWQHKNRRAYAESKAETIEALRSEGKYRILTPQQALETIKETGSLHLAPLCGGLPLSAGWQTLDLFTKKVQPFIA